MKSQQKIIVNDEGVARQAAGGRAGRVAALLLGLRTYVGLVLRAA